MAIEHGERIAMLTPPREEFMYAYMASGMVGAMWLGINTRYTLDEIRYIISDSKPSVVITVDVHLKRDYRPDFLAVLKEFDFIRKCLVIGDSRYQFLPVYKDQCTTNNVGIDLIGSAISPKIDNFPTGATTATGSVKTLGIKLLRFAAPETPTGITKFTFSGDEESGNVQARVLRIQ